MKGFAKLEIVIEIKIKLRTVKAMREISSPNRLMETPSHCNSSTRHHLEIRVFCVVGNKKNISTIITKNLNLV